MISIETLQTKLDNLKESEIQIRKGIAQQQANLNAHAGAIELLEGLIKESQEQGAIDG